MKNFLKLKYFIIFFISQLCIFSVSAVENYNYIQPNYSGCREVYDPYEPLNRKIFVFNSVLDHFILRPIAIGYDKALHPYIKGRFTNFIDNFGYPVTIVNYAAQGKAEKVLASFWRFAINSTLGIGGLFDVASKVGLNPQAQGLGHTLAYYGVGPGPYLVIPFFGASNARDVTEMLYANDMMNPLKYIVHQDFKYGITLVKLVNDRSILMPFTDHISKTSPDPYSAIRNAVHQKRESQVNYPSGFVCPTIKKE